MHATTSSGVTGAAEPAVDPPRRRLAVAGTADRGRIPGGTRRRVAPARRARPRASGSTGVPTDASTMPPGTAAAAARTAEPVVGIRRRDEGHRADGSSPEVTLSRGCGVCVVRLDAGPAPVLRACTSRSRRGAAARRRSVVAVVGDRDPDARRGDQRAVAEVDRLGDRRRAAARRSASPRPGRRGRAGWRRTRRRRGGPRCRTAAASPAAAPDDVQQPVADLVAEVVVHGLEPVEVEVEHREVRLVPTDARRARPRAGRGAAPGSASPVSGSCNARWLR